MIDNDLRDQLKEQLDCRKIAEDLLGQPANRRRYWQWVCPFHDDRDPSLTVWWNGWFCFGCRAHGDHYDLVQRIENLTFAQAHAWLAQRAKGGGSASSSLAQPIRNGMKSKKPDHAAPTWLEKQDDWRRLVDNAALRLDTEEGVRGRAYLEARGILPETWRAWSLGYDPNVQRWQKDKLGQWQAENLGPAIVLPWTNGRLIKAVQYRLLDHGQRYHQQTGSERTLFGVQHLAHRPLLLAIEGELNALSVWQVAHDLIDVVSFGPESNVHRAIEYLQALGVSYQKVLIWADKPDVARKVQKALGAAQALRSPVDGKGAQEVKWDANKLLQHGLLDDFINQTLDRLTDPRFDDVAAERRFRHLRDSGEHSVLQEFTSFWSLEARCGEMLSLLAVDPQDDQAASQYNRYATAWELCRGL